MAPVILLVAVFVQLLGGTFPGGNPQGRNDTLGPRVTFGLLDNAVQTQAARPRTQEAWDALMRENGLTRDEDQWLLAGPEGQLRASSFFSRGEATYSLTFVPRPSLQSVPKPILEMMLRDARYARVQEGDTLEIGLEDKTLDPGGTRTSSVTITRGGSHLVETHVVTTWKLELP